MKFADLDIENRRPVWRALSDLFLDTELQANDLSSIARTLVASPYTLADLETILYREVYPVCISNMRSVAGVWTGFNDEQLEESILKRMKRKWTLGNLVQLNRWMIRDDWNRVKELYTQQLDLANKRRT